MKYYYERIAAAVTIILMAVTGGSFSVAEQPIEVGCLKQLFIDEMYFAESNGVTLKVLPPHKTGEAVLKSEQPWESATINWFSVLQDQGRIDTAANYRMWYEAYDVEGWPTGDDTSFCYAESRDGVNWTKPDLGLFTYGDHARNNILFRQIGFAAEGSMSRVHGTGVFIDSAGSADARYKAVSQGIYENLGKPPHRIAGMYSADGLNWIRYPQPICNLFADSQYSGFWDNSIQRYVIYGRGNSQICRSESAEFSDFKPLTPVLNSNDQDPENSSLYNSAVIKYPFAENIYFMFPSLFQRIRGTLDIRLAVSRDGVHWSRPDQSVPWIALGESGAFDSGSLYMGQGIVHKGEEISMYYSGSPLLHEEVNLEKLADRKNARTFSRVVTRLDRFVAATATSDGGNFETPPLRFSGNKLKLNAKVNHGGSLRVGLYDEQNKPIPGRSVEDCFPIVGDSLSIPIQWKNGSDVGFRETLSTQLYIEMINTELFSFQFVAE